MIGSFGGVNEKAIHTVQSRFQILRGRQFSIWHKFEMYQGVVQNRRERMQVFIGFRARHPKLCPQSIKGLIGLIIIEEEQELVCYRREFVFGAPSRFAPARARLDPFYIGFLLASLVHVTESEQQMVELSLGQAG